MNKIQQIRKIVEEPEEHAYTEWLHKIDQLERIKKILVEVKLR